MMQSTTFGDRHAIEIPPQRPDLSAVGAEIETVLALVERDLLDWPTKLIDVQRAVSTGMVKAALTTVPPPTLEHFYDTAYGLFQQQAYDQALPIALYLSVHAPQDPRFLFMSGLILQVLNEPLMAAVFYACLLQQQQDVVPAAYRLAECYVAVGQRERAQDIFDLAINIGDADEFFAIQRRVLEKLQPTLR